MSDLAPFVAAALRDKVVGELHEEVLGLRQQLAVQQAASQEVTITGPMGDPVYTKANYRQNGKFDVSPELWKVEFIANASQDECPMEEMMVLDHTTMSGAVVDHHTVMTNRAVIVANNTNNNCTLAQLSEMEVRIGGVLKAKLMGDAIEGFVNDIDNNYCKGKGALSIWFGGSSGIWLTVHLQMEKESYRALQNLDLSGRNLVPLLQQYCPPNAPIEFTEVSFMISHMNHAMEAWGMPTEPPEREEDIFVLPTAF